MCMLHCRMNMRIAPSQEMARRVETRLCNLIPPVDLSGKATRKLREMYVPSHRALLS